jgi:hypothetical protein
VTTVAAEVGLRCANCGAAAARATARFCEYCGKALPEIVARPPSPDELLERRFEELENHPELQRHLAWKPGPDIVWRRALGAGPLILVMGVLMFLFVPAFSHGPGPFAVVPWIMLAVVGTQLARRSRYLAEPLERLVAVVSDERQDTSSDGRRGHTSYYATLETRDGARREFEVSGPLAGEIRPGDMGVGYVKGGVLVAFRRLKA